MAEQEEVLPPEEGKRRRRLLVAVLSQQRQAEAETAEAEDGGAEAACRPRREPQGQAGHDAHQEAVSGRREAGQDQDGLSGGAGGICAQEEQNGGRGLQGRYSVLS